MPHIGARSKKLPDDEKSHPYGIRLHPGIPKEKIAIDYIEDQKEKGLDMRTLFVDLVLYRLDMKEEDTEKGIDQVDARKIMKMLKDITDRMKKGFIARGTAEDIAASEALEGASDDFIETFDRFVDMGISADDLEGDDD
jgi:hypothetical protein